MTERFRQERATRRAELSNAERCACGHTEREHCGEPLVGMFAGRFCLVEDCKCCEYAASAVPNALPATARTP